MRYREAIASDVAAIAALHAESWRRSAQRDALRDEFAGGPLDEDRRVVWEQRMSAPLPNQYVVLAEEEEALVGFACAYGADDERWGSFLDNLHVRSERRGEGIGRTLLVRVVRWCLDRYPEVGLYLLVLEGNVRARRFYERLGAVDAGGDVWLPPGGGRAPSRRYAWTTERMAMIPSLARTPVSEA